MYVREGVCVYARMFASVCMGVSVCTCLWVWECVHTWVYVWVYIYLHVFVCVCVCVCVHVCMYVCECIRMCVCMHVYVWVYVYVRVYLGGVRLGAAPPWLLPVPSLFIPDQVIR